MHKNVSIIAAAALLAVIPSPPVSGAPPGSGTPLLGDVGLPLNAPQTAGAGLGNSRASLSTEITVTSTLDVADGDTSSAQALAADPGPDGVSLREAVEVTNNEPGSYLIDFAAPLRDRTITLQFMLPHLNGGGVTIDGDIDDNGTPDVTLNTTWKWEWSQAIAINSSGNHVSGLRLVGFGVGLSIQAFGNFNPEVDPMPTHQLRSDNVISGLDISDAGKSGIWIRSTPSSGVGCGVPNPNPCRTFDTFANTTIAHNTIQGGVGIGAQISNSGDTIDGLTVTDNEIRVRDDAGIAVEQLWDAGDDGTPARISHVLIARNSITGTGDTQGISVAAGAGAAQGNITEAVRVRNNTIHLECGRAPCTGIAILAGSDRAWATFPDVFTPRRYPDDNVLRTARVIGNDISGSLAFGVSIRAGGGGAGGSRNLVHAVTIRHNRIQTSRVATGIDVQLGPGSEVTQGRYATANRVSGLTITANSIKLGRHNDTSWARKVGGGVVLVGGIAPSRLGVVRHVEIERNEIRTGASAVRSDIKLIGGIGVGARRNSVTCVQISANQVPGATPRVSVRPNVNGATDNRASLGGC